MGVFEVGEEMGANLPAVTPAFDMRRDERFAQIGGDLLYQLLPYLPVFLVVGFDLRNAFGLVFFELGKLEKRDIEQIAAFWRQHGASFSDDVVVLRGILRSSETLFSSFQTTFV